MIKHTTRFYQLAIHPTAVIDKTAEIEDSVEIGPYTVIGPNVKIQAGTVIGPHVYIYKNTTIGKECTIWKSASLGTDSQDLKFTNQTTYLVVGDRTMIREFATLSRATTEGGTTRVGNDCFLMAYTHVAHDCVVGNNVILVNAVNMAGHVTIGDHAEVSGMTAIHQFVQVGVHSFIGGGSRVPKDVPPYVMAVGNPIMLNGLNTVGLQRRGFSEEVRQELKRAYKIFFRSQYNISQALEHARTELKQLPEIKIFTDFIAHSERGIII
ncbi:MAG: acyl-[acyl-carrier-protein]--UDP-N-acetylglucosamine O-acyltransferase [Candidatus Glassbacteria bacterium RIFCSPLOWO2_12_FULL_58_11]|uniref:Acyl-[acyl-carrier-protein]--UDP-N-acetylglucosamine O-acyltransferase n=1 Tax=Candidatus Glassbacteria bacterium RIFCSPLOWO2_12_FULL_58_11 TaxID=1817867 RepID=A0A1F5YSU3_9BACT|nr:MAG: acyl-[acyl-carrier-protein]--UDP-N-acetylglucosamine O-acyltransferase [Candidatus Glassbacteria bacterium RIFCSPLOWO2_12_FULL_58_11]